MKNRLHVIFAAITIHLLCAALHADDPASSRFYWAKTYGKSPAKFTAADWRPRIDATWGQGLPTSQKL